MLVESLAEMLLRPMADPFTPEIVAVPTRGIERWLAQQLSSRLGVGGSSGDGVCANIEFPFPGRLIGQALRDAIGIGSEPDPWAPERAVWPLIEVVDRNLDEEWLSTLAGHIRAAGSGSGSGGSGPGGAPGRFATVRHIADLYDRYGVHRPEMIRAWAAGDRTDGQGRALAADMDWQARLWQELRGRIGVQSPAERLVEACQRLRDDHDACDLPERLSLFGLTRLPASYLDVLASIAATRDVHLWLLHPSYRLWDEVAAASSQRGAGPSGRERGVGPRREDTTASLPHNQLLATWGRDSREMQVVLGSETQIDSDHHVGPVAAPRTLLGTIQDDVRRDQRPPGRPLPGQEDKRLVLDQSDRTLQIHSCHGRARQVEVVRTAILHLLAEDPTLEVRDVIVMCPDIDELAPLVHAAFDFDDSGSASDTRFGAGAGEVTLPVRLADRSLRQTNPLLDAVAHLLRLARSRVTASEVLEFASLPPVRARFRLDEEDIARFAEWTATSGIRWGLDGDHRDAWLLAGVGDGTWEAGLKRILLGVAMTGEGTDTVAGVLPVDDVEGSDIDLAGRLAELVDRLGASLRQLAEDQSVAAWLRALQEAVDGLCAAEGADEWQHHQLTGIFDAVAEQSSALGATTMMSLTEVESLLSDRLKGQPTRANFRTGQLTMCTMVPMRSVPHRVVCLVGLDDGVFPRRTAPDGDDLIARDPWVGDQDARSEDRQLLLDALLAATDHLVITYSGRDPRTNASRPPAVPLGELIDVIDRTAKTGETDDLGHEVRPRDRVVVQHPLQPFDPRNFRPAGVTGTGPWEFDALGLEAARALVSTREAPAPFLTDPLPPFIADDAAKPQLHLDELRRFVGHPVRTFLRSRLGVSLPNRNEEPDDALPIELDALDRWKIGDRLLSAVMAGADLDAAVRAERGGGLLPPERIADETLGEIRPQVQSLIAAAESHGAAGAATSVDVVVEGLTLGPSGTDISLVGTVDEIVGDTVRVVTYSKMSARHVLEGWLRLIALTAAMPERPWQAVIVARGDGRIPDVRRLGPLRSTSTFRADDLARHLLTIILDIYEQGMCEPLPLYLRTSEAYARARREKGPAEALETAAKRWQTKRAEYQQEDLDLEHLLVHGGQVDLKTVCLQAPRTSETGPQWAGDETHRFGRLARRLWDPILTVEQKIR